MTFPLSHKTAFVVDHTLSGSSGVQLDMDSFCKARSSSGGSGGPPTLPIHTVPLRPVTKTIWTCAVEAITEYCRIVWDIFPGLRFVGLTSVGGSAVEQLSSWHQDQSLSAIMQLLMILGPARRGTPDLLAGCHSALRALTTPTPPQQQQGPPPHINRGRVIVVTKLHSDQEAQLYYQKFCELVGKVNRSVKGDGLAIAHVHLVLLSFIPDGEPSRVMNSPLCGGGSGVSGDVVEFQCGSSVAARLCSLVVRHYNLASTTVTGIPMKEEQNASSSANYDVELFHPAEAHAATLGDSSIRTTRQDTDYPTVTLKWSTPRTSASHELHQCSAAFRITSVDVNSRPSSCLTNFLLNGRWVMLEMPKKTPTQHTKVMSHMLAAHAGDIYIHTLLTARTVLEDPPSISEGQGGKVTDYRITDFAQLIRANLLAPSGPVGLDQSRAQLEKHTKHWPITISQTTLFSMGGITEPLTRNIVQKELTEEQVIECRQVIFSLLNLQVKGESLNTSHARTKGLKKEDQYRAMWNELEHFLKQHNSSDNHQKVFECFLHCNSKEASPNTITESNNGSSNNSSSGRSVSQDSIVTLDLEPEVRHRSATKRSSASSDTAPDPKRWRSGATATAVSNGNSRGATGGQSLLSLWQQKIKSTEERVGSPQFAGRLKAENNVTKLYTNLQKDKDETSSRRK